MHSITRIDASLQLWKDAGTSGGALNARELVAGCYTQHVDLHTRVASIVPQVGGVGDLQAEEGGTEAAACGWLGGACCVRVEMCACSAQG